MHRSTIIPDPTSVVDLLQYWLERQVPTTKLAWLNEKRDQIAQASEKALFAAFSAVPRHVGKEDLQLTEADLQMAEKLRTGWLPQCWSVDQISRTLLLLALPHEDAEAYVKSLEKLFAAADVAELVALYQSLPLLPHPERLRKRAIEGLRSNITTVFNAIALHNPYPADYFDQPAWNQMVLKALFVGSPLNLIWGLDQRANPELAQMLRDYAHERWAAKRPIAPQLWRSVAPFANTEILADFEKVLNDPDSVQRQAGALACSQSPLPEAKALLSRFSDLNTLVQSGTLTWQSLH
ncbi:EboA family metabolite traffic protein [Leptolyngbyaceae cyanobacterium UHCC 1019]